MLIRDRRARFDGIVAVPRGPDALPSALAHVAVELPSGQAAVTVPIETPPGRNGLTPELRLTYGSVCGPGPFGVGWTLPLVSVRRIGERYLLERPDGGGGDLVVLGGGRFRPRSDEKFARLELADNRWQVRERDGRVHQLAEVEKGRWALERTTDTFGHRIEYRWDAGRLVEVRWLEHGRGAQTSFLATVALDYEGSRCARVRVLSHPGVPTLIRTYHLEHEEAQNGWLLLRRIRLEGHDGTRSESPSPVELSYTPFDPSLRKFKPLTAAELAALQPVQKPPVVGRETAPAGFPRIPLDDARVHRVDLSGDNRADLVIVRDRSIVYWPKLAEGGLGEPVRMADAPELPDFSPERVFLGDVDGDGLADLVYVGDGDVRLYINRGGRGWSFGAHIRGTPAPDGKVSLVSLPGGSAGILWRGEKSYLLDLTGCARPYLLSAVADPYAGTTRLRWAPVATGLPRPVQVVTSLEQGSHTASYVYENPIVRGGFRGFAQITRQEPQATTRTLFGTEGKTLARRNRRQVERPGAPPEIQEWSWGAPATDSVYGVVLTGHRDAQRRRLWWDHDAFGQPRAELELDAAGVATWSVLQYAGREEASFYLVDRLARVSRYRVDGGGDLETLRQSLGQRPKRLIADTLHQYDGQPFIGLPIGQVGKYGARVRTEQLAFTEEWLQATLAVVPPWIRASRPEWPDEYPKAFRSALPSLGGYLRRPVQDQGHEVDAWYVVSERRRYDFQEAGASVRGRVTVHRDELEHDTSVTYDSYELLPAKISDPRGLHTQAAWDYRSFRPKALVKASGGRVAYSYSALGVVERASLFARPADEKPLRELVYGYNLDARSQTTLRRDADGESVERVEFRDARGRLLQTRTPASDVQFAPLPTLDAAGDAIAQKSPERVVVTEPGQKPCEGAGWAHAPAESAAAVVEQARASGAVDLLGRSWGRAALDASGAPVEERDPKGALLLRSFDSAGREVRRWARDGATEPVTLRLWRIYGDSIESGLPVQRAAEANLLGRVHREYDETGLVVSHAYDVDGNVLDRVRQALSEETVAAGPVDWQPHGNLALDSHARGLLDERRYHSEYRYDVKGRLLLATHPQDLAKKRHQSTYAYDRAGRVIHVEVDGRVIVEHASYDLDGRKLLVAWGNGVLQRWARDRAGRVLRLRSERYEKVGDLSFRGGGEVLQEYWCERDSEGRITTLIDDSPDAGIAGKPHRLERTFSYDDEGRLTSATGRESGRAADWPWEDTPRPTEPMQMRAVSDSLLWRQGHLMQLRHDAGRGSFSRDWLLDENWRLQRLNGPDGYLSYQLDEAGRLAVESSVRRFFWDHAGRLLRYRWGEDLDVHYRHSDGDGALKLVRRVDGPGELVVRDGGFVHERGEVERNWLHLSIGGWRLVSLRSGAAKEGEAAAPVRFHLEDLDGSIGLVLDEEGHELGREGYSALGETSWGGMAGQPFRFHGAERDPLTGFYWLNGRPYAPWLGRFADDLSVLPDLDLAPPLHVAPQQKSFADEHFDEVIRMPTPIIVEDRDHGERVIPNPGTRHRPGTQGGAGASRRGMGQGEGLR
jgi:hypothetical protein